MKSTWLIISFSLLSLCGFAQVDGSLKSTINSINNMRGKLPVEKVYLQTDKPYYSLGDTLRFKSYLFDADYFTVSKHSGLLYIELDDAVNRSAKRLMVAVADGTSWGNIYLDDKEITPGSYTLRAYTNFMRNFGEDYVFKKSIYIAPVNTVSTLITTGFKLTSEQGKDKIDAVIHFAGLDQDPLRLKTMQLRLMNGSHSLLKYKASSGMDGNVQLGFTLPEKALIQNLYIQAQQVGKGTDTVVFNIPVVINRATNTDLQFMPEGGNMIAGIETKIAFKAISEDDKGIEVTGKIYNNAKQEVANFTTKHNGMGSFKFTPKASETYSATLSLPNNQSKSYPLPVVKNSGTVMNILRAGNDSLLIKLSITPDLLNNNATYYLIGQARGVVCYAATFNFKSSTINNTIATKHFPTGITRFTLLNAAHQPLNERIVFIDHHDSFHININAHKPIFSLRDSITLNIQVIDNTGTPVQGKFSMAVTDDSQVQTDSAGANLINNLLLTSDLKGTVEQPGWYLQVNNPERLVALDDLMLTQGWVGYDWKQVFAPQLKLPQYNTEKEFVVTGKVTNAFNKPVKNTSIQLFQKKPLMVAEQNTDNNGRFLFKEGIYPADSAFYLLQTKKTFNVGISVDEFEPPVFSLPKFRPVPWYVNSDTMLLKSTNTKLSQLQAEANYRGEGQMLKEVNIKETKRIPGSQNPYPYADVVLDEKEMDTYKKLSLFELLYKRYTGNIHMDYIDDPRYPLYVIKGSYLVVLIIDGQISSPTNLYMDYFTAEDIKGIEIKYKMTAGRYDYALTYITTYSGNGRFLKHMIGRYAYKPLYFSPQKQFYSPKYTIKNKSVAMGTDLRSTIHWEPNITTDTTGKATVSFFSADKPGDYTIIIEGADMNGGFGFKKQKIKIVPTQAGVK